MKYNSLCPTYYYHTPPTIPGYRINELSCSIPYTRYDTEYQGWLAGGPNAIYNRYAAPLDCTCRCREFHCNNSSTDGAAIVGFVPSNESDGELLLLPAHIPSFISRGILGEGSATNIRITTHHRLYPGWYYIFYWMEGDTTKYHVGLCGSLNDSVLNTYTIEPINPDLTNTIGGVDLPTSGFPLNIMAVQAAVRNQEIVNVRISLAISETLKNIAMPVWNSVYTKIATSNSNNPSAQVPVVGSIRLMDLTHVRYEDMQLTLKHGWHWFLGAENVPTVPEPQNDIYTASLFCQGVNDGELEPPLIDAFLYAAQQTTITQNDGTSGYYELVHNSIPYGPFDKDTTAGAMQSILRNIPNGTGISVSGTDANTYVMTWLGFNSSQYLSYNQCTFDGTITVNNTRDILTTIMYLAERPEPHDGIVTVVWDGGCRGGLLLTDIMVGTNATLEQIKNCVNISHAFGSSVFPDPPESPMNVYIYWNLSARIWPEADGRFSYPTEVNNGNYLNVFGNMVYNNQNYTSIYIKDDFEQYIMCMGTVSNVIGSGITVSFDDGYSPIKGDEVEIAWCSGTVNPSNLTQSDIYNIMSRSPSGHRCDLLRGSNGYFEPWLPDTFYESGTFPSIGQRVAVLNNGTQVNMGEAAEDICASTPEAILIQDTTLESNNSLLLYESRRQLSCAAGVNISTLHIPEKMWRIDATLNFKNSTANSTITINNGISSDTQTILDDYRSNIVESQYNNRRNPGFFKKLHDMEGNQYSTCMWHEENDNAIILETTFNDEYQKTPKVIATTGSYIPHAISISGNTSYMLDSLSISNVPEGTLYDSRYLPKRPSIDNDLFYDTIGKSFRMSIIPAVSETWCQTAVYVTGSTQGQYNLFWNNNTIGPFSGTTTPIQMYDTFTGILSGYDNIISGLSITGYGIPPNPNYLFIWDGFKADQTLTYAGVTGSNWNGSIDINNSQSYNHAGDLIYPTSGIAMLIYENEHALCSYNSSASAISAALNALTGIQRDGGCTVSAGKQNNVDGNVLPYGYIDVVLNSSRSSFIGFSGILNTGMWNIDPIASTMCTPCTHYCSNCWRSIPPSCLKVTVTGVQQFGPLDGTGEYVWTHDPCSEGEYELGLSSFATEGGCGWGIGVPSKNCFSNAPWLSMVMSVIYDVSSGYGMSVSINDSSIGCTSVPLGLILDGTHYFNTGDLITKPICTNIDFTFNVDELAIYNNGWTGVSLHVEVLNKTDDPQGNEYITTCIQNPFEERRCHHCEDCGYATETIMLILTDSTVETESGYSCWNDLGRNGMPFLAGTYYLTQDVQLTVPAIGDCHCVWGWHSDGVVQHYWSGGGYLESGEWQEGLLLVLDKNNDAFIIAGLDEAYSFPCKLKHCEPTYPDYADCTGTFYGCQSEMYCEWCQLNYDFNNYEYISSSLHRWHAQIVYCPTGTCPEI
jgi:hypothetical protein